MLPKLQFGTLFAASPLAMLNPISDNLVDPQLTAIHDRTSKVSKDTVNWLSDKFNQGKPTLWQKQSATAHTAIEPASTKKQ